MMEQPKAIIAARDLICEARPDYCEAVRISICLALSVEPGEIRVREREPQWRAGIEGRARRFASPGAITGPAPPWLAWAALAALLLAGGIVLVVQTRATTFWADEWQWILTRRGGGVGSFLNPHNEHLSLVPVTIYKLLFATVGLRHYWPYRAVLIACDLGCALLVFVYAQMRVGAYFGLLAAALILFFGPAWQDILWPFQMAWLIAVGAGIGALLLLDRRDRAGDVGACVLLAVSLASAGPGLAVAAGLVVEVLLRRRWRDLWIVAIPLALYGLWWIGYQHTLFFAHSLLLTPRFVFDAAAGALSALAGLASVDVFHDTGTFLNWGPPLLAVAVIAVFWRLYRLGRVPTRVWTLITIPLAFWLLTAVGRAYLSVGPFVLTATGYESRYLYVSAVFLVLLGVEVARGHHASLVGRFVIGVLVAAAVLSNVGPLRDGTRLLQTQAQVTEAELGTLNLSRPLVKPNYVSNGFIFGIVTAGEWFAAEKDLGGTPAATPAQIAAFPGYARLAADSQLVKIQQLGLSAVTAAAPPALGQPPKLDAAQSGTVSARGACTTYRPAAFTAATGTNALQVTVPATGLLLGAGSAPATVGVRRFAPQFQQLGTLAPSARATLRIAPDLTPQPWHLQIAGNGPLIACGLA
jgi:hypothetical protein